MTRYLPARHYLTFGAVAMSLAVFSGWVGFQWPPAFIPAVLFALSSALLILLAFRPAIEIHESSLVVAGRSMPWMDVRRLDRTGWISPLVVRITLYDDSKFLLVYPGDLESCKSLLRQLRRYSRDALIDGIPYRQYWGEVVAPADRRQPAPRYRVLRPEDEADVERLYQRLKAVGNLDQKSSDEG